MKIVFYIYLIFFSTSVFAETALQCNPYKQCTTINDLGCSDLDKKEDVLVIIDDENEFLNIKHDLFFNGKYIISEKNNNEYSGYGKINLLNVDDLEIWANAIEKKMKNEITEESFRNLIYLRVFKGRLDMFILDRFLLNLKLKLVDYFPGDIQERLVVDYKCERIEKKI